MTEERRKAGRPPGATRLKVQNDALVDAVRERLADDPARKLHDIAVELAGYAAKAREISDAHGGRTQLGGYLGTSIEGDVKRIKRLWAKFGA